MSNLYTSAFAMDVRLSNGELQFWSFSSLASARSTFRDEMSADVAAGYSIQIDPLPAGLFRGFTVDPQTGEIVVERWIHFVQDLL